MFSVIIPLYNKAPYVEKAIRSVLAQTYREFELIVIDDGSTDDSLSVAKKCLLQTINYKLIEQHNQGVSTARNNGVKQAKYPYICFLDADDWWAPTFLEEMKALIDEFPDAGIYGSAYYIVKNGQQRAAHIGVDNDFSKGLINYCRVYAKTLCMPLWTGATIIKKTIFEEENGFKPKLKLGEDFDLWIRIAMKHPVAFLNKQLAYYNQDVDVATRGVGVRFYLPEEHMLFTDYGELMNDKDFRFLYEKLALYGLLRYYLNNKNKKEIEAILKQIQWKEHSIKYSFYYRFIPKCIVKSWFFVLKYGSKAKQKLYKVS